MDSSLSSDIQCLIVFMTTFLLARICFQKPADIPVGPRFTLPLLGDLLQFARLNGDVLKSLRMLHKEHGDIYSFYMGRQLAIIVNGYELIHKVLVEKGVQFCGRPQGFMRQVYSLGKGLGFSTGDDWKKQRSFVTKSLQKLGVMKRSFEENILREYAMFEDIMEKHIGRPFDMHAILHASTANALFTCIVGKSHEYNDPFFQSLLHRADVQVKNISRVSLLLNCVPWLQYIPGDPLRMRLLQRNYQKFENDFEERFINVDSAKEAKDYISHGNTLIDMYMEKINAEKKASGDTEVFSISQMKMVVWDLFIGGGDTTTTAIRWAILYLLNCPEVLERLHAQLDEVTPPNETVTLNDEPKLPYMKAFIAEVLRVSNILPLIPRANLYNKDSALEGYHIPKNSNILLNLDSVLMDPKIFENPTKFNPDRFLDESGRFVKRKELIPLSAGRRKCIGESLANTMVFLYLANMLKVFTILPAEEGNLPKIAGIFDGFHVPNDYMVRCVKRN